MPPSKQSPVQRGRRGSEGQARERKLWPQFSGGRKYSKPPFLVLSFVPFSFPLTEGLLISHISIHLCVCAFSPSCSLLSHGPVSSLSSSSSSSPAASSLLPSILATVPVFVCGWFEQANLRSFTQQQQHSAPLDRSHRHHHHHHRLHHRRHNNNNLNP